jgi:hypothetical protein
VLTVEVSDATGALAGLHATALTLYRSIMSPKGARYEPLARRALVGSDALSLRTRPEDSAA